MQRWTRLSAYPEAKPILDLMLAVRSLQLPRDVFRKLSDIGYEHRADDTVPGRLFFAKGDEGARTHYLSICDHTAARRNASFAR